MTIGYPCAFMNDQITSVQNPYIKALAASLVKTGRSAEGDWLVEGPHLVQESLQRPEQVQRIFATNKGWHSIRDFHLGSIALTLVSEPVLAKISSTDQPQGIVALVKPDIYSAGKIWSRAGCVAILDGLQDPGNVGTIVRCAEAFRLAGLLFLPGTAQIHQPKVIRSSAGSALRVATASVSVEWLLKQKDREFFAADVAGQSIYDLPNSSWRKGALIIGSEGAGVQSDLRAVSRMVRIPTVGVESLNAGVAAGILFQNTFETR
jgi:RNA methyltransferase, TrmH family